MAEINLFDSGLSRAHDLFDEIEAELGWEERHQQTYVVLRAVLHALRDRLTVEQSSHLAAELPIVLKGVFYDGWSPASVPIKMNREEFIYYVSSRASFQIEGGYTQLIRVVTKVIFRYISQGEAEKIYHSLPKDIQQLIGREEHIFTA